MPEKKRSRPGADEAAGETAAERKSKTNEARTGEKKSATRGAAARRLRRIARLLEQVGPGGELEPFSSRQEWERVVDSNPPELQNLLRELARFADLWRYFQEREERLGSEIVGDVGRVHRLNLAERVILFKDINRRLMQRVNDGGKGTQSRH